MTQKSDQTITAVARDALADSVVAHGDYGGYADDEATFDIRQIIAIVRANLLVISLIVALSLVLAIIATMLQTPRYTAETTLQINDQSAQILGKQDDISQDPVVSSADTERFLQTQIDILKSRALAERVAQKLRLVGNSRFYDAMGVRQPSSDLSRAELEDLTLSVIEDARDISLPRNSRLATISFVSTDPELAARIANTLAAEFIQANLQRRFDSSAYARDFISGQLSEARAKLERSERELNAYARQAGLIRDRDPGDAPDQRRSSGSVTTASLLDVDCH